jgi:hypothetical protein
MDLNYTQKYLVLYTQPQANPPSFSKSYVMCMYLYLSRNEMF